MSIPEYQYCLRCGKVMVVTELRFIEGSWAVAECYCVACEALIAAANVVREAVIEDEMHAT